MTALSTHLHQEFVEEPHKTTTIQTNYDWYHGNRKGISRQIIGMTKIITLRTFFSHISPTSGDGSNMTHKSIVIK